MDFTLSPEIEDYRLRVRAFIETHVRPLESQPAVFDEHENIREDIVAQVRAQARACGGACGRCHQRHARADDAGQCRSHAAARVLVWLAWPPVMKKPHVRPLVQ